MFIHSHTLSLNTTRCCSPNVSVLLSLKWAKWRKYSFNLPFFSLFVVFCVRSVFIHSHTLSLNTTRCCSPNVSVLLSLKWAKWRKYSFNLLFFLFLCEICVYTLSYTFPQHQKVLFSKCECFAVLKMGKMAKIFI